MDTQLLIFDFKEKSENAAKSDIKTQNSIKKALCKKNCELSVFVDGAARGNPGPAGAGIYIIGSGHETKGAFFLGEKTNNQAEYLALVLALFLLMQEIDEPDQMDIFVTIHSDSELLVRQLSGIYKIKNPALIKLNSVVQKLLHNIPHKFVHVLREKNKMADKLANEGIDKKKKIPTNFFNFLADLDEVNYIVELLKK